MAATINTSTVEVGKTPTGHVFVCGSCSLSADYVASESLDLSAYLGAMQSLHLQLELSSNAIVQIDKANSNYAASEAKIVHRVASTGAVTADNTNTSTVLISFFAVGDSPVA